MPLILLNTAIFFRKPPFQILTSISNIILYIDLFFSCASRIIHDSMLLYCTKNAQEILYKTQHPATLFQHIWLMHDFPQEHASEIVKQSLKPRKATFLPYHQFAPDLGHATSGLLG